MYLSPEKDNKKESFKGSPPACADSLAILLPTLTVKNANKTAAKQMPVTVMVDHIEDATSSKPRSVEESGLATRTILLMQVNFSFI